ncbi:MAG TPA: Swt1 family HEPN domain-containing protein, partial [Candidatus Dormibacteraeota bacterium]
MALSNHERVGKALELVRDGLRPFVEREVKAHGGRWPEVAETILSDTRLGRGQADPTNDVAALLVVMDRTWSDIFRRTLGKTERSLVNELLETRNRWAHQEAFSTDQTYRALDSAELLLNAVSAPQSAELEKMKAELLRLRFDEQVRGERRKAAGTTVESAAAVNLKPWREVVTPHKDVASGRYQQAEFAADLQQVHLGEGTDEYKNPVEFFRRTYLTESLRGLLVGAARRLSGQGGDPVVQLQTNFGGGKTHSMLALYHLFGGPTGDSSLDAQNDKGGDQNDRGGEYARALPGVDVVLSEAGVKSLPAAKRVVLVGTKISPGDPVTKPDGTVVRTLWGELAWQLGGKQAFARVANDDERATNPGDKLRELFNEYGPCLILIDEWVAYARQLHDQSDLPAGGFETQFTFAQALTESARAARNCLV